MINYRKKYLFVLLLVTVAFSACKKQWDERTQAADQQLDKNLFEQIQGNGNLSTFAGFLTKLGYDKVLAATRTYTVWAPDNQALQGLDPALVADTAKLRMFVANHIANQVYLTTAPQPSMRIRTLNGKNVTFTASTVEEATVTGANQYVRNGVVHVINKPLTPKLNIFDYIKSLTTVGTLHKAYLQRQDSTFVDTARATVSSIDPTNGKPILVPGTGVVTRNKYFTRVANLSSEDSLYTYFVLTDEAYNAERNKVSRFFTTVTNSTDTTMNILAAFNVLKDVAVRGIVKPENLPAVLLSVNGVNVPVNKAAIVQTYNASNGIVYVVNSMDFKLEDKITPFVIQGERPSFYKRTDRTANTFFRSRRDPDGIVYSDLFLGGADLPIEFYVAYRLPNLYTCRYRVVWRAISEVNFTTGAVDFSQRLTFGQITGLTTDAGNTNAATVVNFPYTPVGRLNYTEKELTGATVVTGSSPNATINVSNGTLNVAKYSSVFMFAQGSATAATGANVNRNAVTLDYVKLIPILQ
jgi:uncharacterized surface protein with fasciclin (FAS1) repeats